VCKEALWNNDWFARLDLVGTWRPLGCDTADTGVDAAGPAVSWPSVAAHTLSAPATVYRAGRNRSFATA